MIRYVAGFFFDKDECTVALVRKSHPEWQKGRLNAIGGKVESGEPVEQAMVREFEEETSAKTQELDWRHVVTLAGPDFEVTFFDARGDVSQIACGENADGEYIDLWFVDEVLDENVIFNLHWLIPLCLDKDIATPVSVYDRSCEGFGMSRTASKPGAVNV